MFVPDAGRASRPRSQHAAPPRACLGGAAPSPALRGLLARLRALYVAGERGNAERAQRHTVTLGNELACVWAAPPRRP
jgi:hypothetical protein